MATPKRQIFYSFHFANDVMRVQQIRNIGVLEENKPISPNDWEEVKRKGDASIKKWIDDNMKYRSCVVVLIGKETATRPWVIYELRKAWEDGKGLLGVYIHNLKCPRTGTCAQGANPFTGTRFSQGGKDYTISCYNPKATDAYNDIRNNLSSWIETAIAQRG